MNGKECKKREKESQKRFDDFLKLYRPIYDSSGELITIQCAVCKQVKPISKMRNVDCVEEFAESEWIYACDDINPHGLGGTCYGKYDRERHFLLTKEQNG